MGEISREAKCQAWVCLVVAVSGTAGHLLSQLVGRGMYERVLLGVCFRAVLDSRLAGVRVRTRGRGSPCGSTWYSKYTCKVVCVSLTHGGAHKSLSLLGHKRPWSGLNSWFSVLLHCFTQAARVVTSV